MEMWLVYNDEIMARTMGEITTKFVSQEAHGEMLEWKDVVLAQGAFEEGIPYATRVEWYYRTTRNGVEYFAFRGFWTANKTRAEAMQAKYGSIINATG